MNSDTQIQEEVGMPALAEPAKSSGNDSKITLVPLKELHPFSGHPFRVMLDADMDKLVQSVKSNGVLTPGIVRPRRQGGYEIISGHRRREASRLAGKKVMPVIIREDLDDTNATIAMVEVNLKHRSRLLPSEKARAYRMMRDALMTQSAAYVGDDGDAGKAKDIIATCFGESASKVMRTIRLTYLNQPLLDLVDGGKLKLGLAVQISYLDTEVQCWITDRHEEGGEWPTFAQIKALRALFEQGQLTQDAFDEVMSQAQPERQSAANNDFIASIRDEHFPNLTLDDVKEKLLELIEQYQHRKRLET